MIYIAKLLNGFGNISTSVIYAQAYHETGGFTSQIFKENKNLFGMRQAKVRNNYASGTNRGHAIFKTHWDSVRDYFERQKNFNIPNSNDREFMVKTVNSGYAEDKNYLSKWEKLSSTIKKPVGSIYLGMLFFFLLVFVVLGSSNKNYKSKKIK